MISVSVGVSIFTCTVPFAAEDISLTGRDPTKATPGPLPDARASPPTTFSIVVVTPAPAMAARTAAGMETNEGEKGGERGGGGKREREGE
jgi:hypothetical protein